MKISNVFLTVLIIALAGSVAAEDIAVTVYNGDLGVVNETRELEFDKGVGKLAFRDVPARIDASSVRFQVANGSDIAILEQNYAFDLVSPDQMYAKYLDQTIELIDKEGRLYGGQLLAYSGNMVTLLESSGRVKIVSLSNITEVNFPVLPDGLITRPTLFWLYQSNVSGKEKCEVSYQTSGMNWTAEYVGLLNEKETHLDLSGWASINNVSGKTYADARLKLIAGDINRARPTGFDKRGGMELMTMAPRADAAGFEEKEFFEYHMYTLPRKATLANKEVKQVSLFEPASTSVDKKYLYKPDSDPEAVSVNVEFTNSKESGLGMPLPAGRVRMFKADSDGSLILLGEDQIEHTPKDEEVMLTIGTAFDIKGEQTLVSKERISKQVEDRVFEIELRNHKSEDVVITIEKRVWGFWEVVESNFATKKKDANTLTVDVPVKADSTAKLTLKVRITSR